MQAILDIIDWCWRREIGAGPLRAPLMRYILALAGMLATSEAIHWAELPRPWSGGLALGFVLVAAWWGGPGPAVWIPPLLLALSRWHRAPGESWWLSRGEIVALGIIWLIAVSIGLAGEYRRRIQSVRREHEQKLKDQARALSQARIVFRDMSGRITEWSDGAEALYGWASRQALQQELHLLLKTEFPMSPAMIEPELLRTGQWQGEVIQRDSQGRPLNISTHWILYRDVAGRPIGVAEVQHDVTELRRAEAAVREADRRKDEFLATLAHELRNPLAPIRDSLEVLRLSDRLDPSLGSVRDVMEEQVQHLIRLVDDLLEVSRVTHGKIELQNEPVTLQRVVTSSVDIVRNQIDARGLRLQVDLPPEQMLLQADPVRMTQVISNLLGNAAKYTNPGGQIWVAAERVGNLAVIRIRDDGAGIPREMLTSIFDMFSQVDRTLTKAHGGLGIGLTLVKRLVELHGGSIAATSAGPDQGSEFTIRLPVLPQAPRESPAILTPPEVPEDGPLPRRRVLVVDDTRAAGVMLGKLLEALGQTVQVATDGQSALRIAATYRPEIVFSDIAMPVMDGYELARRLTAMPECRETLLVALTGFGQREDQQRALEAGFDLHLVKPANLPAIRSILLERPGSQKAPRVRESSPAPRPA